MEKKNFYLIMLLAIVFVSGCETVKTIEIEKAVPNEALLDILGITSFVIAVFCAGVAIFSKEYNRRLISGAIGIIFLFVGILFLKACPSSLW